MKYIIFFSIFFSAHVSFCMDSLQKLPYAEGSITTFLRKNKGGILGDLYHETLEEKLKEAFRENNLPKIERLLFLGVDYKNYYLDSYLKAIAAGDIKKVKYFHNRFAINILQEEDELGYTPLHIAVQEGNLSIIKWLLSTLRKSSDKFVLTNKCSNDVYQVTPLQEAIIHNKKDIANFLIDRMDNINRKDQCNLTLLQNLIRNYTGCSLRNYTNHRSCCSVYSHNREINIYYIKLLLSRNADINLPEPTKVWKKKSLSREDGPRLCYRTFLHAIIQERDYNKEQRKLLVALSLMCNANRQQDSDDKYPEEYTTDYKLKKMVKTRECLGEFFNTKHLKNRKMLFEVKFKRDLNLSIALENFEEQNNQQNTNHQKTFDMTQFLHNRQIGVKKLRNPIKLSRKPLHNINQALE